MEKYTPRLIENYNTTIKESLQKSLSIKNTMRTPRLQKIVLNMGLGDAKDNKTSMKQAIEELALISGQKPVLTKSKKAISNFKIRIGDPVGLRVTLRRKSMYEFFDRFISITSPRIRDFRGFSSKGFDGNGNYNFGISEQIVFPEIDYDKVNNLRGMNITIVTSAENDLEAYELLSVFGFPIKKRTNNKKETEVNISSRDSGNNKSNDNESNDNDDSKEINDQEEEK